MIIAETFLNKITCSMSIRKMPSNELVKIDLEKSHNDFLSCSICEKGIINNNDFFILNNAHKDINLFCDLDCLENYLKGL